MLDQVDVTPGRINSDAHALKTLSGYHGRHLPAFAEHSDISTHFFVTHGPGLANRSRSQRDPDVNELTAPRRQMVRACLCLLI